MPQVPQVPVESSAGATERLEGPAEADVLATPTFEPGVDAAHVLVGGAGQDGDAATREPDVDLADGEAVVDGLTRIDAPRAGDAESEDLEVRNDPLVLVAGLGDGVPHGVGVGVRISI